MFDRIEKGRNVGAPGVFRSAPRVTDHAVGRQGGADAMQRVLPFRLPLGFQATWIAVNAVPGDNTATREELRVSFRPASEAIAGTVRWLYQAGHITTRRARRAATRS